MSQEESKVWWRPAAALRCATAAAGQQTANAACVGRAARFTSTAPRILKSPRTPATPPARRRAHPAASPPPAGWGRGVGQVESIRGAGQPDLCCVRTRRDRPHFTQAPSLHMPMGTSFRITSPTQSPASATCTCHHTHPPGSAWCRCPAACPWCRGAGR